MRSYDISCRLGELLLEKHNSLKVDVKKPDFKISVEIREQAFIYGPETRAPEGFLQVLQVKAFFSFQVE